MFSVKEVFYSIQGEGFHSGRPTVFVRFSGCNLWSGREKDRKAAICSFCDTDFVGTDGQLGGRYSIQQLLEVVDALWPSGSVSPYLVFTGGEPALQITEDLVQGLQSHGVEVGIETNGTLPLPASLDWVCVSPKANTTLKVIEGDELKVVYPQHGIDYQYLLSLNFSHFYLQPMADFTWADNVDETLEYVLQHPKWKLSLQTHKIVKVH